MKKMKKYALMLAFIFLFNISYPNIEAMSIDNEAINELSENMEQTSGGEIMKTPDEEIMETPHKEEDSIDVESDSLSDFNDSKSIPNQDVTEKYNMRSKLTNAYSQSIISSIENPINNQKLTGDFLIKGFAISMKKISKIEVYLDGVIQGQATYGISRSDIESKYSTYPDSGKSGFTYKFTNVPNGTHTIKTVATDSAGETQEQNVTVVVDNAKTMIMSKGTLNRNQMIKKLRERNATLSLKYISDFVDYTINEANIEGVNYDILFSQMMHETRYLNFGGDVKPNQNNFAGLGATGNGVPGESFETVQIGIRAVVQHLKAYASNEPLKQECVDSRFNYVTRMSAIYVEHLGIQENPDGRGWAASRGYGYSLLTVREDIAKVSSVLDFSVINDVSVNGNALEGNVLTVSIIATPANDTLYKVIVKDEDNKSQVLSDWSSSNTAKFTPIKAGKYTLTIYAKNKNSNSETNNDVVSKEITISQGKSQVTSLNVTGDKYVGSTLTMKAEGTPAADTLYKLWVCDRSTGQWTVLSDYSTKNSVEFKPTKAGQYTFTVHVKHKSKSGTVEDDYRSVDVQVTTPKSTISSMNVVGNTELGNALTLSVEGTPAADTLYKLWVCDRSTDTWTVLSDWSTKNTIQYTPKKVGKYTFTAYVKNKYSNSTVEDVAQGKDFYITEKDKSMGVSLDVTGEMKKGKAINISSFGAPENDTLYKIWICNRTTGSWTVLSDWSVNRTATYTPQSFGVFTVVVHFKHKNSTNKDEDDYLSKDINIKGDKLIVIDPGHNQGGDYGSVSTHNGIKYSETDLNMEVSVKLKAELERRGYQVVMTRNQGEVSYLALRESLEKRVDLANNLNADLFISIHHNSFGDPTVRGVEVYYSTETPGSRGLLLKSSEEVSIQSKSTMISTEDASKISTSRTLATNMVNSLSSRIGYINRGARDNDFYVVKNTLMPSVLVECGFISNPTEAAMVANPAIQQKVAEALASAVAGQF